MAEPRRERGPPGATAGGAGPVRGGGEDAEEVLKRRIEEVIFRFGNAQMSVRPEAVSVNLEARELVVTLTGMTSRAEREWARNQPGRRLLEEYHREVYEVVRPAMETAVGGVLGRAVNESRFSLDARTGHGVMVFPLAENPARRRRPVP